MYAFLVCTVTVAAMNETAEWRCAVRASQTAANRCRCVRTRTLDRMGLVSFRVCDDALVLVRWRLCAAEVEPHGCETQRSGKWKWMCEMRACVCCIELHLNLGQKPVGRRTNFMLYKFERTAERERIRGDKTRHPRYSTDGNKDWYIRACMYRCTIAFVSGIKETTREVINVRNV